jgi:hypothetical protein
MRLCLEKLLHLEIVNSSVLTVHLFCLVLQHKLPLHSPKSRSLPLTELSKRSTLSEPRIHTANMAEDKLKGMDHSEVHYFNKCEYI